MVEQKVLMVYDAVRRIESVIGDIGEVPAFRFKCENLEIQKATNHLAKARDILNRLQKKY